MKALRTAIALGSLIVLAGLHTKPGRDGGDSDGTGGNGKKNKDGQAPAPGEVGPAIKHAAKAAKKKRPKNAKLYPSGHYRTPSGKYAGSDGKQQDGSAAEDRVIQRYRDKGFEVADKGPGAKIPKDITGTWERSFTMKDGTKVKKGDQFTVTEGTPRFYDGFVKKNGKWYGLETKSGGANRKAQQRAIDNWLNDPKHPERTLKTTDGKIVHGVITHSGE